MNKMNEKLSIVLYIKFNVHTGFYITPQTYWHFWKLRNIHKKSQYHTVSTRVPYCWYSSTNRMVLV